jgi:hypothetical protein
MDLMIYLCQKIFPMDTRRELLLAVFAVNASMERALLQGDDDRAQWLERIAWWLVGAIEMRRSDGPDGATNEKPRHIAVVGLSPAGNLRGNTIQTSIRLVTAFKEYQLTVRLLQREMCRLPTPAVSVFSAVVSYYV